MSLKQNTNKNSNLKSKKLVGGKLRQKGGSGLAPAESAGSAPAEPAPDLIPKPEKVPEVLISLVDDDVKGLLDKIDSKFFESEEHVESFKPIIKKIVNNAYNIAYGIAHESTTKSPFQDWSDHSSKGDVEKTNYWKFRRILIDSMILYSTCLALLKQKPEKPEQGETVILFNKKTLREVYKGLESMELNETDADKIINFLNQDIRQETPKEDTITIDIQAFGSNSVTSDYDISILVPENEDFNTLPAEIFKYFRKLCSAYEFTDVADKKFDPLIHFNPRIHFDTNLYPHPIQFPDSHPIIKKGETIMVNASITAICPTGDSFLKLVTQENGSDYRKKIEEVGVGEGINLDLINANVQLLKYFMDLKEKKATSGLKINPKCLVTGGADDIRLALVIESEGNVAEKPNVTGTTLHSLFAIQYIRLCEACSLSTTDNKACVEDLAICHHGDIDTNIIESENIQIYTKLIGALLGKGEGAESKKPLDHKKYLHLIHQALFYSVETYYSISAIVHVVFILQNKAEEIKVKFKKGAVEGVVGGVDGGAVGAEEDAPSKKVKADADAIKKMKIMLAISAIEQFAFILHYLKTYDADADADAEAKAEAKATFIKKTAKYVARLCHAHDLIIVKNEANLKNLLGIDVSEEDRKGINKVELLQVGEYQKIIDKHKDGKPITFDPQDNDPYNSLTKSGGNIKGFIKAMYDKVVKCLKSAAPTAE
jgi:hypothetical protein